MAFDLTQKPFEQLLREVTKDRLDTAKQLSKSAVKVGEDYVAEFPTRRGNLWLCFKPSGRVKLDWRDRGGIKEGWFTKDWHISMVINKWDELVNL